MKKLIKNYLFIFKELRKSSRLLPFFLLLTTTVTGLASIITKYILKIIVTKLGKEILWSNFLFLVFAYTFILVFSNVINNYQNYLSNIANRRFSYNMQTKLMEKIRTTRYDAFFSPEFQNLYTTVQQSVQTESSSLVFVSVLIIRLLVRLVSNYIVLAQTSLNLSIILTICIIPSLIIQLHIKKAQLKVVESRMLNVRKINYSFMVSTEKAYVNEFRLFNLHKLFLAIREKEFAKHIKSWVDFGRKEFIANVFSCILPCIGVFISILWMIAQVQCKRYSIADFIFYSSIVFTLQGLLQSLVSDISQSYKSIIFFNKFFEFLEFNCEIKSGTKNIQKDLKKHVLEFRNVYFSYPYSKKLALKDVSFIIGTNEMVAFVGQNGCGKTSIVNLMLRIYTPTSGTILLDGIDINEYEYEEYLQFFSAVFQDYQKYSVKIRNYIMPIEEVKTDNYLKIEQAIRDTTATEIVKKTPYGIESELTTRFNKEGIGLSGGQWQKLVIARTLCSDAHILIFDEATSAIDRMAENEICNNLISRCKNKISIFISHRIYITKYVHKIIYMEEGKIKDIGSHEELIRRNEGYKKLFYGRANKQNS
ncbi:MAG: ABC transporter ATP-binding protein [Oscillospiraceae bacterium]|nr:ABC transporter ATP-binding protein [Oscillospiraceae bacterium]